MQIWRFRDSPQLHHTLEVYRKFIITRKMLFKLTSPTYVLENIPDCQGNEDVTWCSGATEDCGARSLLWLTFPDTWYPFDLCNLLSSNYILYVDVSINIRSNWYCKMWNFLDICTSQHVHNTVKLRADEARKQTVTRIWKEQHCAKFYSFTSVKCCKGNKRK
jgi:hypothetical protein